ncbi:BlaI/MecI/CopY family transcriptional regulator [Xylocopilactobacillus apis]|uniref:Penicillinase repressor n=1 Tax=Xylocopilactobacillus apis TaxID=2932183 RepID=A0AAU9CTW3_9LACO|nr:BlaI/MecI/CopY family transcriptional regulator [Xylocopilactobacillus apis]BDR55791.1 hypothetical protein KIMC2_03530 [Xylocopilactobacillus apis]
MKKLTNGEEEVMIVLWESDKPLSSKGIVDVDTSLKQTVVQSVLRRLLKKGFIKTSGIAYSGPSITREYEPLISEEDYFSNIIPKSALKKVVNNFITNDENEEDLKELYQIFKDKLIEKDQSK